MRLGASTVGTVATFILLLAGCASFGFGGGSAQLADPAAGCGAPRGRARPVPRPRWVARAPAAPRSSGGGEEVVPRWLSRRSGPPRTCIFCDYTDPELEPVRELRFTEDGRRLVVAGDKRLTTIWDLQTSSPLGAFRPSAQEFGVFVQAISPDGRFVSNRAKDTLELWDTTTHTRARGLAGHRKSSEFSEEIDAAAFDATASLVATGDEKSTLRLWAVGDGRLLRTFDVGHGELQALAFSPDRRFIATASDDDAAVRLRDVETGRLFAVLPTDDDGIANLVWSNDGRRLAAADYTKSVVVWDLERCKAIRPRGRPRGRRGWSGFLSSLAIAPRGDLLVGAFLDDGLAMWDAATGARIQLVEPLADDSVNAVAISPGGELLAAGTALGTMIWRLPSLEPLVFLAQSTTSPEAAYVLDLVRPDVDVDVFGASAEPWPEFGGHFEAFGGAEKLLLCRTAGEAKGPPAAGCIERRHVAGLLSRRLLGEELIAAPTASDETL